MKLLFITHSGNLTYGAAKSLEILLKTVDFRFDIVFDSHILGSVTESDIKNYVGDKCDNVYFCHLPLYYNPVSGFGGWNSHRSFIANIKSFSGKFYRRLRFLLNKKKIEKMISSSQYDYVVINSIILYPLLSSLNKCVLYLREIIKPDVGRSCIRCINKSCKIICIDNAVNEQLEKNAGFDSTVPHKVITNPFDMTDIAYVDTGYIRNKYGIADRKTVYLMAGSFAAVKGVDFVLDAFTKCSRDDVLILVAGEGDPQTTEYLHNRFRFNSNILFLGKVDDMLGLYAVADYVVRGESAFCTGRTVYEALYSGCSVLLPGTPDDIRNMDAEDYMVEHIHFYVPRDTGSLVKQIDSLAGGRFTGRSLSNSDKYYKEFSDFVFGNGGS